MSQDNNSNDPARKPPRSAESILSAGMGTVAPIAPLPPELLLPRLSPEGGSEVDDPVYDCIVYLIFCAQHQRLAVTNYSKCKCLWLPFVALSDDITWAEASHDGVLVLIGRTDAEVGAEEAEKMRPVYTIRYVHVLRLQLPTKRVVTRLAQYVQLEPNTAFQCCINTDRVNWLPWEHIHEQMNGLWGPELWIFARMLSAPVTSLTSEFSIENALFYVDQDQTGWEHLLLKGANLSRAQVLDIYGDFVEHTWPSFYMCYDAFRAYLIKNGHPVDENKLWRLYAVFRVNRRTFVDFHEFLVGLVCLEPTCPSTLSSRLWFIFRYYSTDQQFLSAIDITTMLGDAHPDWQPAKAATEAQAILDARSTACLSLEEFIERYHSPGSSQELDQLCRSPKSILAAIAASSQISAKERQSQLALLQPSRQSRRGCCWSCRWQKYEYGTHLVTFNSDGRCVEPRIIQLPPTIDTSEQAWRRYSIDYVFSLASAPNIFLDLIRDFFDKRVSLKLTGLLATESDAPVFVKYLRVLCKDISQLLAHEAKLLKINSSAIVAGDLRGNLRDLLALEKAFFQGFPVIAENLVFLGNYSGDCGYGVECLIFLLALKLVSPNKVFLLRGSEEVSSSKTSIALKKECHRKYGAAYGKMVYNIFLAIFAELPIALLVDETILCTHGGIPASSASLTGLLGLPKEMAHLERDAPMAYEMVTRYPEEMKAGDSTGGSQAKAKSTKKSKKSGKGVGSAAVAKATQSSDGLNVKQDSDVSITVTSSVDNLGQSKDELKNFKFTSSNKTRFKPMFLSSLKTKMNHPKSAKSHHVTTQPATSERAKPPGHNSFDRQEFINFLDANGVAFLIRGGTVCPSGCRVTFDNRCLSLFTCSNYEKRSNEAAVVLIDGIDQTIRTVRFRNTIR